MGIPARARFLLAGQFLSFLLLISSFYPLAHWIIVIQAGEVWQIITLTALAVYGILCQIILFDTRKLGLRTNAPEVFYFSFFLILSTFEVLRIWFIWLNENQLLYFWGGFLTRTLYFARLTSVMSLFVGALYPLGWRYKRSSRIGVVIFALSLFIVMGIPVNSNNHQPNGLYLIGEEPLFLFALGIFFLLAFIAQFVAYFQNQDKDRLSILVMTFLLAPFWIMNLGVWNVFMTPFLGFILMIMLKSLKKEYEWA